MSFVIQISWTCPCIVHTNFTVCPSNCLCCSTVFSDVSDVFGCILYQKHNNEVIAKQFRFRNIQIVKMNCFFSWLFLLNQFVLTTAQLEVKKLHKMCSFAEFWNFGCDHYVHRDLFWMKKNKNLLSATHWSFSPTRAFFVWHILSIAL